ncbi:MAG: hypothetical protein U9O24_06660 [Campylobacterota bacterium]|nr:hypothetical protein [Campylobacterota bacterium]
MIRQLLTPLLMLSSLYAEETEEIQPLDPEVVQSLYIESALFIAVFTLMSIISIVISKKHAAQNLLDDRAKREKKKLQEEEKQKSQSNSTQHNKIDRTAELTKMLNDGLITNDEFQILSKASQVKL